MNVDLLVEPQQSDEPALRSAGQPGNGHSVPAAGALDDQLCVRVTVPAGRAGSALLAASIRTMTARTVAAADAPAIASTLVDTLAAALPSKAGAPLAMTLAADRAHTQLVLALDDRVLCAVDCMIEAEGEQDGASTQADDLGAGLFLVRRLMDAVEYVPSPGANRWRLVKQLPGGALADDCALTATFDLPASYRYLNVVGDCIGWLLAGDESTAIGVQLAAQETLLNIIDHAYRQSSGRITLSLTVEADAGRLVIETSDSGTNTFDLAAIPDRFGPSAPKVRSRLLSGSALLLASATLVNAGNYLFNLLLGRWLGPAAFADLSLIVTLFLVTSFITAGLQTPAARFAALFAADGDVQGLADVRRWSGRRAAGLGVILAAVLCLGAPLWAAFFATNSIWPFLIFGVFVPFYLVQGVDRGLLQGRTRFGWLAVTYQAEMWSRLAISIAFVAVGWAVNGAVLGIGLSFVIAWLVASRVGKDLPKAEALAPLVSRELMIFTGPVLVAQLGQILINNSDILIVRRFFPAADAGTYAALALIGRMVFFATWSVVTAMFPIAAQRFHRGEAHRPLLYLSLGIVLAGSLVITGITYFFPEQIVNILFGPAYLSIAPLLWLYAVATMLYALANVVINYRLSIGNTGGTYMAIIAGVAQVASLWIWHESLAQVVLIQVGLMGVLFAALMVWDWTRHLRDGHSSRTPAPVTNG